MKLLIYRTPDKQDVPEEHCMKGSFIGNASQPEGALVPGPVITTPYKRGSVVPECGKMLVTAGDYNGYPFWQ